MTIHEAIDIINEYDVADQPNKSWVYDSETLGSRCGGTQYSESRTFDIAENCLKRNEEELAEQSTLAKAKILSKLPSWFQNNYAVFPSALIGARILNFGTPILADRPLEGGGLAIDYIPVDSEQVHRVVFSFNELCMWVAYDGPMIDAELDKE